MQLLVIIRILGLLLMVFSTTMLPPVLVDWIYQENASAPFLNAFVLILIGGFVLFLPVRKYKKDLRLRDGFMVVVMFWFVLGSAGGLPLYLSEANELSITDAVFESISGLTTTGATVIVGLDDLPHSILFYRQFLQWLGGMGIIVLAVAVLPMLGIGGMQLYRAETPGPVKDTKLTPRITETAKALWYIYLGLTISCGVAYWLAGMNAFDAISHAFSTVAIGGFSTHDASMGYFNNRGIELIAIVFMLLSGVNFALHFAALRHRRLTPYLKDAEFGTYIMVLSVVSVITISYLYMTQTFTSPVESLIEGLFQVVSIGTTTGFTTQEYYTWPGFLPVLLLYVSFIGGCAGSTGGGIKVIRILLLVKQGMRELRRLVHPSAQFAVKIGRKPVPDKVIEAVWGFFAAYFAISALMILLLMASGLNQDTAFSAVAACLNNLGPGLDEVGQNFASINDFAKWVLCLAMLLGRLEIFTLLVLLTPGFWRK
ncbi:MAG: potassium transporter [Gammaproteobacteria bacterium]|jgi:trk system potassium uptake protein TrkH|nr:potassium transporter [Gammaproteobacteria bacterium]MBT3722269.1 potassium transporter [Gammaproteobacteria bacterium]MBT4193635.1 potassium transporter [Gammaproteobacteria bacterium]MBT4450605.1 potassium transporter [Gammaproteobacteria bacterium]MBT4863375.1 potassium transporter [Gammaproteobacteria bacterium]